MPNEIKMSEEHRKRHQQLHKALSELIEDFMRGIELKDDTTLLEFRKWSWKQTKGETENE